MRKARQVREGMRKMGDGRWEIWNRPLLIFSSLRGCLNIAEGRDRSSGRSGAWVANGLVDARAFRLSDSLSIHISSTGPLGETVPAIFQRASKPRRIKIYHLPSTIYHLPSAIGAQRLKLPKQLNRLTRESLRGHGRLAAETLAEADRHGGLAETGLAGKLD